jgi:hypothetical protein
MKNILKFLAISLMIMSFSSAKAEIQYGFAITAGQADVSGTETEGTAADTSDRSKSIKETFVGGDIFIESVSDSGMTYGLSYVPIDVKLGSGSRTDTATTTAAGGAENDTGTRTAEADLSDLVTAYANIPFGTNGWYTLLGVHMATVETTETLNTNAYPNEDIFGAQIGFGQRNGNMKYEFSYSNFEEINISSAAGANSVSADADVLQFRLSYGF